MKYKIAKAILITILSSISLSLFYYVPTTVMAFHYNGHTTYKEASLLSATNDYSTLGIIFTAAICLTITLVWLNLIKKAKLNILIELSILTSVVILAMIAIKTSTYYKSTYLLDSLMYLKFSEYNSYFVILIFTTILPLSIVPLFLKRQQ